MFREIFPEEEGNHSNVNEWCGPRCGGGCGYGMFMGWQGNDHGHIRDFVGLEMFNRVKDSFHKYVKHLVPENIQRALNQGVGAGHVREGFHVEVMPQLSPKRQLGIQQVKVSGRVGDPGRSVF